MQIHEVTENKDPNKPKGFFQDFAGAVGTGLLTDLEKYAFGSDVAATLRPPKTALGGTAGTSAAAATPPKTPKPPRVYRVGGQILNPAVPDEAKMIAKIQAQEAGETQ